jgi:tryptophan-rich sensory protein
LDLSLAVFIGLNVAAAASGAVFKPGEWYEALNKPAWRPPNYAFPIVWTALYALIAVAGWRVWNRAPADMLVGAMGIYGLQTLLNAGWSAIFFGLRNMRLALVELMGLWLSIVTTILVFAAIDGIAALLLLPYLAWVSVAGMLNLAMIRLNPAPPAQLPR